MNQVTLENSLLPTPNRLTGRRRFFQLWGRTPMMALVLMGLLVPTSPLQAQRTRKPVSWVNPEVPPGPGLKHHVLSSSAMGHDVGYVVWTPEGYDTDETTRFPVVYFLHGMGGHESADSGGFSSLVRRAVQNGTMPACICVFPNGGRSFYAGNVEQMIVEELIPLIDRSYRTQNRASSRVVAGFSMGGAGAVRLSLLYPELFCAAGSWGGGMFRDKERLLAAAKEHADALKRNQLQMLLVNGDGDRPEAFEELSKTIRPLGIAHEIVILKDTKHSLGKYYELAGEQTASFLGKRLKHDSDQ